MDVYGESFRHLLPTDVGDSVEGETVIDLVVVVEVLPDRVDDEPDELRILVHEQRESEVALNQTQQRQHTKSKNVISMGLK
jgi:hypothetical protein